MDISNHIDRQTIKTRIQTNGFSFTRNKSLIRCLMLHLRDFIDSTTLSVKTVRPAILNWIIHEVTNAAVSFLIVVSETRPGWRLGLDPSYAGIRKPPANPTLAYCVVFCFYCLPMNGSHAEKVNKNNIIIFIVVYASYIIYVYGCFICLSWYFVIALTRALYFNDNVLFMYSQMF